MNKQILLSNMRRWLFAASALSLLVFVGVVQAANVSTEGAQLRTPEMVNAMDAEIEALGLLPVSDQSTAPRPTRDDPEYAAAKAAANLAPQPARPELGGSLAPPTYAGINFSGVGRYRLVIYAHRIRMVRLVNTATARLSIHTYSVIKNGSPLLSPDLIRWQHSLATQPKPYLIPVLSMITHGIAG